MAPTYFFDCFDGDRHVVDEHGVDLATEAEAREHAVVLAQTLLVDTVPDADARSVSVTVRAREGVAIYVAHCSFTACWTKDRALATPIPGRA